MEPDFHGNFRVNVTWFFALFSGLIDQIMLILVWFERSPHTAQVSRQSCPWLLSGRKDVDPHRRLQAVHWQMG